jgi:hypothetical protein
MDFRLALTLRSEAQRALPDMQPLQLAYLYRFLTVAGHISATLGSINSNIPSIDGQGVHGTASSSELGDLLLMLRTIQFTPHPRISSTTDTKLDDPALRSVLKNLFQTILTTLANIAFVSDQNARRTCAVSFGRDPAGLNQMFSEIVTDTTHRGLFSSTANAMYLEQHVTDTLQLLCACVNAPLGPADESVVAQASMFQTIDAHLNDLMDLEAKQITGGRSIAILVSQVMTYVQRIVLDCVISVHCLATLATTTANPRIGSPSMHGDMLDLFDDVSELRRQRDAIRAERSEAAAPLERSFLNLTLNRVTSPGTSALEYPFGVCFIWVSKALERLARELDRISDSPSSSSSFYVNSLEVADGAHSTRIFDALETLSQDRAKHDSLVVLPVNPVESALLCAHWCQPDEAIMANMCAGDLAQKLLARCAQFLHYI